MLDPGGEGMIQQPMPSADAIDDFFAAVLRGEPVGWPDSWNDESAVSILAERVRYHGIAPLLVARGGDRDGWPEALLESMRDEARLQEFWELSHRDAIVALLRRLHDAGIESLLMKGTVLAYSAYARPAQRRRGDTDILVRERDLEIARGALAAVGFRRTERHVSQDVWEFDTGMGFRHALDLHWELVNAPALAHVLDPEDCFARAVPLAALCAEARAMDPVFTLLQCALNRAAHTTRGYVIDDDTVFGGNRLGWAVDFDLIARRFAPADWTDLLAVCAQRGLAELCLDGLGFAQMRLATPVPAHVTERLAAMPSDGRVMRYLQRDDLLDYVIGNLKASAGMSAKLRYLAAYVLLERSTLLARYPHASGQPLIVLRGRRVADLAANFIKRIFA